METVHTPSSATMHSDAPVDNHGKGESYSPTDLVATGLLTCVMTIIEIRANKIRKPIQMTGSVEKHMASSPRRIERLLIVLEISAPDTTQEQREWLEKEGRACPVGLSLHPDIVQDIQIRFIN